MTETEATTFCIKHVFGKDTLLCCNVSEQLKHVAAIEKYSFIYHSKHIYFYDCRKTFL